MDESWVKGIQRDKRPKRSVPSGPAGQSGKTIFSRVLLTIAGTKVSRTKSSREGCLEELAPEAFWEAESRVKGIRSTAKTGPGCEDARGQGGEH